LPSGLHPGGVGSVVVVVDGGAGTMASPKAGARPVTTSSTRETSKSVRMIFPVPSGQNPLNVQ